MYHTIRPDSGGITYSLTDSLGKHTMNKKRK